MTRSKTGRKRKDRVFFDRFREPDIVISEKQKIIIRRTWKVLSADMKDTGIAVFLRIFNDNPEIKQLFPYRDKEIHQLLHTSEFKRHASRFMHAVGMGVANLDELEKSMSPTLLTLGKQHYTCVGFRPIYFEIFYRAIVKVFREKLGLCYTAECEEAWCLVLVFMMEKLKKGYHLASIEQVTMTQEKPVKPTFLEENLYSA